MYHKYFKIWFDFFLATVGLILATPSIVILAVLIRIFLGKPILFKQLRPGLCGKSFMLYKFRTMKDIYGIDGQLIDDNLRMTKFGQFLRSFSLDELPELLNVLKGDMSLVGPRPLLMEYLNFYSSEQMKRHSVRPGITGWAQINGRNNVTWDEKFAMDLWYIKNKSFLLDVKILFLTVNKVLLRENIGQKGYVSMEKFRGTINQQ